MKFCPNCGNALTEQSRFCPECGFKVEAAPAPVAPPPAPVFEAPVAPPPAPPAPPAPEFVPPVPPAPPVQEFVPPVAPPPAPPVQEFVPPVAPSPAPPAPEFVPPVAPPAPPVQEFVPPVAPPAPPAPEFVPPVAPPAPPVQEFVPPVAPPAPPTPEFVPPVAPPPAPPMQNYAPPAPPVQNYGAYPQQPYAPQQPKPQKPAGKSRLPLFIGIGVAVVLIILAIIFVPKLFGGASVEGIYEGVSISMMGMEMNGDTLAALGTTQMELKSDGKCAMILMDEAVSGTYTVDGEKITFVLDGVTCEGTLKDGKLTFKVTEDGMEMTLVFQKKEASKGGKPAETTAPPTPVGKYEATSISMMGTQLTGDLLASAGETWLEIKDDGNVTLMLMDDEIRGTYTVSGETISCDLEGVTASGAWDGTQVTLQVNEDGVEMIMNFSKSGATAQPGGTTASGDDWWAGDWYGWWIVSDGDGEYADLVDTYWDACASIEVDGEEASIILWDEDSSKSEPMAQVELEYTDGFGDHGAWVSTSGSFTGEEVGYYDWMVDSDGDAASGIEHIICIEGSYTDDAGDSFDYYVFLRPWGMEWDDVQGETFTSTPYEDMMPGLYDSWYLPLIESGVTAAPATIG